MERGRNVELGRRVRYLRHLPGASDGRLPTLSGRKQEGLLRQAGLRCRLGRMQSFLPLLLHVVMGKTE